MAIKSILRGIWQLRDPALVQDLGERRIHLATITTLRQQYPYAKIHSNIILVNYQPTRLTLAKLVILSQGTVLSLEITSMALGK